MFLNKRKKPAELLFFEALSARSTLSKEEKDKFEYLKKGYIGECEYDSILEKIGHDNLIVFRDIYLKIDRVVSQYDVLLINDDGVIVNEVKNYSGDYEYKDGSWYKSNYQLSEDPLIQLKRSSNKIIKIAKNGSLSMKVGSKVVFVNDDFYLESDDENVWKQICIKSNMNRYLRSINYGQIGNKARNYSKNIERFIVENPYFKPTVDIRELKTGFYCGRCSGFNLSKHRFHFKCADCGSSESSENHILRLINDYKFLFYNQGMTKNGLLRLVDHQISERVLQYALKKFCDLDKKSVKSQHVFKYYDYNEAIINLEGKLRYKNHYKEQ